MQDDDGRAATPHSAVAMIWLAVSALMALAWGVLQFGFRA
jgi:hypothetical protein